MQIPSNGAYGSSTRNGTVRSTSIETGLLAAKNIVGERHDLDQVNADQEYHEIKRIAERPGAPGILGAVGAARH